MLSHVRASAVCASVALAASAAHAQPTMPNEFESAAVALSPLFSYFGGVNGFGVEPVATTIHSGASLRVWANFRSDIFSSAGFAIGTLGINAPQLAVPSGANRFSLTVDMPPTTGTLGVMVTIREDDNADGAIAVNDDDDAWVAGPIFLAPGVQVINIPFSQFELDNPGVGNGVQNFLTTPRMGYLLTFETRNAWPGGRITSPVSLRVDHVGLYVGDQSLPQTGCAADFDGDGVAAPQDIFAFLVAWFSGQPAADFDGQSGVQVGDIFAFLAAWFAGC